MKIFSSHTASVLRMNHLPQVPKIPRVVVSGVPNSDTEVLSKRLAIDLGVSAISLRQIFSTLLANENYYSQHTLYRQTIKLLKSNNPEEIQATLERDYIPEKLLSLTKYAELGFVLFDYPNTLKQAEKYNFNKPGVYWRRNKSLRQHFDAQGRRESSSRGQFV